jgi:hypothetical protein
MLVKYSMLYSYLLKLIYRKLNLSRESLILLYKKWSDSRPKRFIFPSEEVDFLSEEVDLPSEEVD